MKKSFLALMLSLWAVVCLSQATKPSLNNGFYFGLNFSLLSPLGANQLLGHSFAPGLSGELKSEKTTLGLTFDLVGVPEQQTKQTYFILNNQEILARNTFAGVQIKLNYGRELWSNKHFIFDAIGGLGYGRLSYYNPNQDLDVGKSSLIISPALSLKYLCSNNWYLQLRPSYEIANYKLKDSQSSDLSGHFFKTTLSVGLR